MRKDRRPHIAKSRAGSGRLELLLLGVVFFVGAFLGCLSAGQISEAEGTAIASYMEEYLLAAAQGQLVSPGLFRVLSGTFRWPIAVVLLSCGAIGLIAIPVVFCIRGFLLSFSISTLILVLGRNGMVLAALLFGVTGLLSVPVFFLLGSRGMTNSAFAASGLSGRKHSRFARQRDMLPTYVICIGLLILCAFVEQTAISSILVILAETVL